VHKSATYTRWITQADMTARVAGVRSVLIGDRVNIVISVMPGKGWRKGRDLDNVAKPILDWSVRSGLLIDDDWEHVPSVCVRMVAGNGGPAQVVVTYEVLNGG
jgi:hypothetical protein